MGTNKAWAIHWRRKKAWKNKEVYGYVMQLEDDCWYVGATVNPDNIRESKWKKLHPVIAVETLHKIKESPRNWIKQTTLDYMVKYGFDKVRGSPYNKIKLNSPPQALQARIMAQHLPA